MKTQFPIENSITDLDFSSPVLDQSRPVKRFVLGSIVLHILSASAVFMLRPLPQPVEEVVEIQVGAGPQAPIESAPQQTEIIQEAKPIVVEKPVEVPVVKQVAVQKPVESPSESSPESVSEPIAEVLPVAELETAETPVSEEAPVQMAAQPEVTSEEIREQVEEKLETTPIVAAAEATEPTEAPVVEQPVQQTSGQGDATQSSSPAPVQGELRSLAQLRQMPGNPKPMYEPKERRLGHNGNVIFKAFVTQDGRLSNFQLLQSTGHKNLDFKTLKALKQWKFYPGQEGWVELPFKWDLKGGPQEMPTQLRRRVGQNSN
jgi:TonB family protein